MPSLRRTVSSPSVRSSPYRALSSASNGGGPATRGHGHRHFSGSETSTRRVLADIEWWRVADGQRDVDQEPEDPNRDQTIDSPLNPGLVLEELFASADLFSAGVDIDHSAIVPLAVRSQESSPALPMNSFAALSISPRTPPRRRHSRQSSGSSLESTPEAAEPDTFEGLRLSITDRLSPPTSPTISRSVSEGYIRTSPPLFTLHGHAFNGVMPGKKDLVYDYADFTVSPLSSASPLLFN